MKRRHYSSCIALLALVFLVACGDSVTNPGDPENGTMTASVDGTSWSAFQVQTVRSGNIISIAGSDTGLLAIGFSLQETGPGTYTIGTGQVTSANVTENSSNVWTAGSALGSGSVVLSTITDRQAIGTFSFVAELAQGTGAPTRTVTNGVFSVGF